MMIFQWWPFCNGLPLPQNPPITVVDRLPLGWNSLDIAHSCGMVITMTMITVLMMTATMKMTTTKMTTMTVMTILLAPKVGSATPFPPLPPRPHTLQPAHTVVVIITILLLSSLSHCHHHHTVIVLQLLSPFVPFPYRKLIISQQARVFWYRIAKYQGFRYSNFFKVKWSKW